MTKHAAGAAKQALYRKIEEGKALWDSLYPIVDTLEDTVPIECPEATKNDAPSHVLQNYTLVFEDIFKGQSELDASKWNTALPWGPSLIINDEEQYYVDTLGGQGQQIANPFVFGPDGLAIEAAPLQGTPPVTGDSQGNPTTQTFTSGVITTRDTCCFKYGYVEVCLKDPCCPSGMWTAAWLLNCLYYSNAFQKNQNENGGQGNDKFNPEIDFKESVDNYGCDSTVKNAYHYFTGDRNSSMNYHIWDLDANNFTQKEVSTGNTVSSFNTYLDCDGNSQFQLPDVQGVSCNDFHTVGVDWRPDRIDFYVNGQLVNCISGPENIISDQDMYLIINFAVGGSFPFGGLPGGTANNSADPADYPARLEVEYARIYLHPDSPTEAKSNV